jgi:hypothetical protein
MNAKKGFHWKLIEDKPDNWETLQILIQNSYIDKSNESSSSSWTKNIFLDIFIQLYPEMKKYIKINLKEEKNNKKISNKDKIKLSVEKEQIKKEFLNIKFDDNLKPIYFNFNYDITFGLMILLWCHKLLLNSKALKIYILDATITINRYIDSEKNLNENLSLKEAFLQLQEKMNKKMTSEMYNLLFQNPIYLIQSTVDKRKKTIKLYKEQTELIDKVVESIIMNKPLLMGNQMPTGTGKSFLAVPLAQKIQQMKRNKTILFACSNELVNQDIACTALLGNDLHLWLSRLIRDDNNVAKVLLRPYKRCFPSKWKAVYKSEESDKIGSIKEQWNYYSTVIGKVPDIIVADLESCYELLKHANEIENPFIAYIDEFVSDEYSNILMGKICPYLPKQTILLSAILPSFDSLMPIIDHFSKKYDCQKDDFLYRVKTYNVPITCAIIDQEGKVKMPHHNIFNINDLDILLREIETNPRIRRCYTAKHVYFWAQSLNSILEPHHLNFNHYFPNIGRITNINIIDYTILLLQFLKDNFEYLDEFKKYTNKVMDHPNKDLLFTEQTKFFDGKTLFISNDLNNQIYNITQNLFNDEIKWSDLVKQTLKNQELKEEKLARLDKLQNNKDKSKSSNGNDFNKLEKDRLYSEIMDMETHCLIPKKFVLNSLEHFNTYHPGIRPPRYINRLPNILPDNFNDGFDEQQNLNIASGIGFYDKTLLTIYQRNLMMSYYKNLYFICSNIDIVFGTNLPELVNIFICSDFVNTHTISTLYQLMGRVGRIGRSYHANIILDSQESVDKILCLMDNVDTIEIQTLLKSFQESLDHLNPSLEKSSPSLEEKS